MKIKILGSGGAFSQKWGNTQMLIDTGNPESSILFDCGEQFLWNMNRNPDFSLNSFKNIFITHTHSDHVGGLSTLALMCYFYPFLNKPRLISRREILKNLWNGYLATNLETLAYGQLPDNKTKADITDFFDVIKISENSEHKLTDGVTIRPIQTMHVVNSGDFLDSFGLMILHNDKKIFLTGDTQFAPYQMMMMYEKADMIIHDCETSGKDYLKEPFKSGVHAHFSDLFGLPKEIKEKMYLIHYGDNITKEDNKRALECGFKGFLYQGDEICL